MHMEAHTRSLNFHNSVEDCSGRVEPETILSGQPKQISLFFYWAEISTHRNDPKSCHTPMNEALDRTRNQPACCPPLSSLVRLLPNHPPTFPLISPPYFCIFVKWPWDSYLNPILKQPTTQTKKKNIHGRNKGVGHVGRGPDGGGGFRPWPSRDEKLQRSSAGGAATNVRVDYHMGPVVTGQTQTYIIWYGLWSAAHKATLRDFLRSISASAVAAPSVQQWWRTVRLYTDQTGSNVSSSLTLAAEVDDLYSHGRSLTRMTVQHVIKRSLTGHGGPLPAAPQGVLYLVLTAADVAMQDYCRAVCGFHYFTYPSIAGYALPYAWVGNSGQLCPEVCAYPFAVPAYMGPAARALKAPNGDVGIDGMVSVVAHELAEMATNPLINAWFAGGDPTADLCEGMYGPDAGGSYTGMVLQDKAGATYNMVGVGRRRFLVQWVWSPLLKACTGPNRLNR